MRWHPHALADGDGRQADAAALAYATASADSTAKLWNMEGTCLSTLAGHTNRLARAAFHPCGTLLFFPIVCSRDQTNSHFSSIQHATPSRTSRMLSGSERCAALVMCCVYLYDILFYIKSSDEGCGILGVTFFTTS